MTVRDNFEISDINGTGILKMARATWRFCCEFNVGAVDLSKSYSGFKHAARDVVIHSPHTPNSGRDRSASPLPHTQPLKTKKLFKNHPPLL